MSPLPTSDQIDAGGRLLARFGFPALLALLLISGAMYGVYQYGRWAVACADRREAASVQDRAELQRRLDAKDQEIRELTTTTIAASTEALRNNTAAMEAAVASSDAVRESVDELADRFDRLEHYLRMSRVAAAER